LLELVIFLTQLTDLIAVGFTNRISIQPALACL
jgi:hypothetical protein